MHRPHHAWAALPITLLERLSTIAVISACASCGHHDMVLDMTNEQKQALLELWFDYYPRVRVIARIDGSVVPDGITPIPNHEGYALFDMGWGQAVPCPPTVTTRDIQVTLLFAGRTHQCRFPLENVCTVANMDSGTEYMSLGFEQTVERRKPELRLV